MKIAPEFREACAVCASALGAAFVSGREASAFFASFGAASWSGVAAAACVFGLLAGMLCRFSLDTGASALPGIFYVRFGQRCGDAVSIVHGLLMLTMGAVALSTAGELGKLSLNISRPGLWAAAAAGLIAVMLTLNSLAPLSALGLVFIPVCIVYFAALALDPRPAGAGAYLASDSAAGFGGMPFSIFMGAIFAFLKAAAAGGVTAARAKKLRPAVFGICCGVIMAAVAGCANRALLKAGPGVTALNLPCVVLAAHWGVTGYYVSIYVMWLGCICMLACALGSVSAMFSSRMRRSAACICAMCCAAVMTSAGLRGLVDVGYPILGWLSAICLGCLAVFRESRKARPKTL